MLETPESLVDLQSLLSPVVMSSRRNTSSSSSAVSKTANLNALVAAGGGRWITSSAINTYLSENDEDEYDYLQSKPELEDGKQRGGGAKKKGRRHAGEAILQRKLSRQAYLVKDILAADGQDAANHLGKKRRARLLSDHLDDFNVSVPYSLNRKNRWDAMDNTASCLIGCNTPASLSINKNQDEPLKFSIVESYFRCNLREGNRSDQGIRSYQEFDADGQLLIHREANSARGSSLRNLTSNNGTRTQQDVERVLTPNQQLNVQYRVSRAHPVGKVMGINSSKNKSSKGKCVKRVAAELVKGVVYNGKAVDLLEDEDYQDENEDELLGVYKSRKNHTYTLYDFLKENQGDQPVLVRRNKSMESFSSGADIEEQYNFVLSSGAQLAESVILKSSSTSIPTASELPVSSQFNHLKVDKPWLFEVVDLPLQQFSLHTQELWQQQQSHLKARRPDINCHVLSESRLLIDLSQALVGQQQALTKPLLVICVDQHLGKVVLNTGFKCTLHLYGVKKLFRLKKSTTLKNGLDNIVKLVLDLCRPFYLNSLVVDRSQEEKLSRNMHNSQRLAVQAQPTTVYEILERQKAQFREDANAGGQPFEMVFPEMEENQQEDEVLSEISDIETIDMDEFEDDDEAEVVLADKQSVETEKTPLTVEVCEQCGDKEDAMVYMLENCGHRFCTSCLAASFMVQLELSKMPIKCLDSLCECEVPLDLLQVVLPLPLANYTASLHYLTSEFGAGKVVSECPSCHDLVAVDGPAEFGQLCCNSCKVHWCVHCRKQPHWPLKCAQAREWFEKFEQQYQLDRKREAKALMTRLPIPTADSLKSSQQHNTIAQQFSLICSESRARRLDTKTGWQLAKNMRRLTTSVCKWQSQFVDVRITALHLLEYGYAWLYMNRAVQNKPRPQKWSQMKVMLSDLYRKVEALDNEVLFSPSVIEPMDLVEKLNKLEQLVNKVIEKFLAGPSN